MKLKQLQKIFDCVWGCHKTQLKSDETETATENFWLCVGLPQNTVKIRW
jgi:hypothetical protein